MESLKCFFESFEDKDVYSLTSIKEKFECEKVFSRRKCILFGASEGGGKFRKFLEKLNIEIIVFLDNNKKKWGTKLEGIPICDPQKIQEYRDIPIIITSKYVAAIDKQLKSLGVEKPIPHYILSVVYPNYFPNRFHKFMRDILIEDRLKIENAYSLLSDVESRKLFLQILRFRLSLEPDDLPRKDKQGYQPIFSLSQKEDIVVDVGAYDGDTLLEFITCSGGDFQRYIAFEPDEYNFKRLLTNIPYDYSEKIITHKLGVGCKHEFVSFSHEGNMNSSIVTNGENKIELISLDEFFGEENISMIKMDVEGVERDVLLGAVRIIQRSSPRLLVSAYHYPEDLWNLQLQVHSYNPSYKFYLTHLDEEIYETMLYCL